MDYPELLDATIRHLEAEKARGVKHLNLDPANLAALAKPLPRPARPEPVAQTSTPTREAPRPAPQQRPPAPTPAPTPTVAERPTPAPQPSRAPNTAPMSREEKERAMADLQERARQCVKCDHLVRSRRNVVFGVGNIHTDIMFVGEAPGMDEDAQGEPFVGKAGQLLDKIITAMGLSRQQVFIGNVLKCRPDTPGQQYGNRKPTPPEMATCLPYLASQIEIIRPKVIIGLGGTALEGLFGKESQRGITRLRGNWLTYRDIPVMPTFHPSYLLRSTGHVEKRKVWEDMLAVMEHVNLPISEKQRGFFLNK